MLEQVTEVDRSASSDTEAGYIHSVAPDPRRPDPLDNPRIEEEGCLAITEQKKYYEFVNTNAGNLILPYMIMERMKNEVAAIRYIQSKPPFPLRTSAAPSKTTGATTSSPTWFRELEGYVAQMHTIKSKSMGSFLGDVILPCRVSKTLPHAGRDAVFKLREAPTPEFVLCHDDISYNVMVDETTLKITAILDWEYAGYYPAEFDGAFYLRPGPSAALEGEEDDVPKLLEVLDSRRA
ncbi:hypothetical protein FPV67DRAFT_1669268 [Lyophyllum atratum]|nr:hypothetical protein FPV67DRAFT_1669268 [Lyophyllum atratum]